MFEPQSEPIQQLPWHQDAVRGAPMRSPTRPPKLRKMNSHFGWASTLSRVGWLRPGPLISIWKSTIYPVRINANLGNVSDGPMKDKHSVTLSERDSEVTEALCREAAALQSHLLWITDLLMLLAQKLEQPGAAATVQPILSKVLDHQKWIQALLTDDFTKMATNAILFRRDLAIRNLGGQVPSDSDRYLI